jgi:hypothetical protein
MVLTARHMATLGARACLVEAIRRAARGGAAVPDGGLGAVCEAVKVYRYAREMAPLPGRTTPRVESCVDDFEPLLQRFAAGQANDDVLLEAVCEAAEGYQAEGHGAGKGGVKPGVIPFGTQKGRQVREVETDYLVDLRRYLERAVKDLQKSRFRVANKALLAAVQGELQARGVR